MTGTSGDDAAAGAGAGDAPLVCRRPRFTLDLRLRPAPLGACYWTERSLLLLEADRSVCRTYLLIAAASLCEWWRHESAPLAVACFASALVLVAGWLRATHTPLYRRRRTAALVLVRLCLLAVSLASLEAGVDLVADAVNLGTPKAALLLKIIHMGHLLQTPFESLGLPLPFAWQCALACVKTAGLLSRGAVRGYVALAAAPGYVQAADELIRQWGRVLQSPLQLLDVPPHPLITEGGYSCSLFHLALLVHISVSLVLVLYAVWVCEWCHVRSWLSLKADAALDDADQSLCLGGGACVSADQLLELWDTPAASVLLDNPHSPLLAAAMHCLLLWGLLQLAELLAALLALQALPGLLGAPFLHAYCPAPGAAAAAAGGVAAAGAAAPAASFAPAAAAAGPDLNWLAFTV